MELFRRVTRCALVGWALYLVIALSAFALHTHSSHEGGVKAPCAVCLAQNVTGALICVAGFVLHIPVVRWNNLNWSPHFSASLLAPQPRQRHPRGPPVGLFPFLPS